jgi:hypothetical protein
MYYTAFLKSESQTNLKSLRKSESWVQWYTLMIPALRRLRQEDFKFHVSQGK